MNPKTGSIDKSKKVSKHVAAKRLRSKMITNQKGRCTSDYLLSDNHASGLFSIFLKESKQKVVQKAGDTVPLGMPDDINVEDDALIMLTSALKQLK